MAQINRLTRAQAEHNVFLALLRKTNVADCPALAREILDALLAECPAVLIEERPVPLLITIDPDWDG